MTPNQPRTSTAEVLRPILIVLGRVRRRLRWQAASVGAVQGGIAGAGLSILLILLYRAGVLSARELGPLLIAAAVLPCLGGLLWALRGISPLAVAGRIDRSHELHDRLGSALQFRIAGGKEDDIAGPQAMLRELAVQDAMRVVPQVVPARAAPWHRPRHLGVLLGMMMLLPAVMLVRLPRKRAPQAAPEVAQKPPLRLYVEPELIAPEREDVERLLQEAVHTGDDELEEIVKEMQRLLDQAEQGELSRKEAFDRLSELEQRLMQGKDGALEELREKLRKAGDELGKDKLAREVGQALKKEDLDKAQKELHKLAEQAQKRAAMSPTDKQSLAQSLHRAAEQARPRDQWQDRTAAEKQQRQEQELREEERRLKKQMEQNPRDEESVRRLKKVQRELERLEREKQERAEAQRELERLQRDLQQAAEEMQKQLDKMSPEQRKALEQLAKDMDRMQDEIRKLQRNQGQGQGQAMVTLGSIKQVLRRVARSTSGSGQGGPGQGQGRMAQGGSGNGQDGQEGQGNQGQGKQGQNKGQNKGQMKDFLDRASGKGKGDSDSDVLVEGEGQGDQQTMILGEGNNPVLLPGLGQKGPSPGPGQGQDRPGGDGIGKEHDPNLLGDPTHLDARRRLTRVTGKEGAGPSRSETIQGSAERGFATQSYRKVYGDYTAVSEEVMSRERVPPGYRFYVKRYFQLIKPRE